jgi:hypothetical protein
MAKTARRVISHHESDCPNGPHNFRDHRCLILTRIDRRGEPSRAWVSGDCQETIARYTRRQWAEEDDPYNERPDLTEREWRDRKSERIQRKDHTFARNLPTWYGGGFWEKVTIAAPEDK